VSDHVEVVAGRELGADGPAERAGPLGILVGDGEEAHRGVAGGHVGAEGPDPAGADDRDADLPALGHAREDTLLRPRGDRRPAVTALDFSGYLSELSAIWSPTRRAMSTVRYSCPVAASITDSVRTGGVSARCPRR